jgi:DNA-binding NtrC family response regulator
MAWTIRNWRRPFGGALENADGVDGGRDIEPIAFVVDDEDAIVRLLAKILASLGIESVGFRSAEAANAALQSRTPAIIFLDLSLDGSEAADVIGGLGETAYPGIVQLMSGSDLSRLNELMRFGETQGLNMWPPLEKPFRLQTIRQLIGAANLAQHKTTTDDDDAARSP